MHIFLMVVFISTQGNQGNSVTSSKGETKMALLWSIIAQNEGFFVLFCLFVLFLVPLIRRMGTNIYLLHTIN